MKVLVTGVAGFIGMHVCLALLSQGEEVIGVDNLNDFYDPVLKLARLSEIQQHDKASHFSFHRVNIAEPDALQPLFEEHRFDIVIHLAAQAGVRYSLENPRAYVETNITGFLNLLEAMRGQVSRKNSPPHPIQHFLYASSSSVYGGNTKLPFHEDDPVDQPVSLYAATKRSNELMACTYAHLFKIPSTGMRFFTVYGPWGRPDMAYFSFARAILEKRPIELFNFGDMQRDFTYIDDVVESIIRLLYLPPPTPNLSHKESLPKDNGHRILNIGHNKPEKIEYLVQRLEHHLGKKVTRVPVEIQPGDVVVTFADSERLQKLVDFRPKIELDYGIEKFSAWFLNYMKQRGER